MALLSDDEYDAREAEIKKLIRDQEWECLKARNLLDYEYRKLEKLQDRFWHAEDKTWWRRDGNRLVSADAPMMPSPVQQVEELTRERDRLKLEKDAMSREWKRDVELTRLEMEKIAPRQIIPSPLITEQTLLECIKTARRLLEGVPDSYVEGGVVNQSTLAAVQFLKDVFTAHVGFQIERREDV